MTLLFHSLWFAVIVGSGEREKEKDCEIERKERRTAREEAG